MKNMVTAPQEVLKFLLAVVTVAAFAAMDDNWSLGVFCHTNYNG